jgi:hypothetical protein
MQGYWEPGAVATTVDAIAIPTGVAANGVRSDATVWFSSSLWFHARPNAYMGV